MFYIEQVSSRRQIKLSRLLCDVIDLNNKYNDIVNDKIMDKEEIRQEIAEIKNGNDYFKTQLQTYQ